MTKFEIFLAVLMALLVAAAAYYFFFGFSFFSRAEIGGFDRLIAGVDKAVGAGRIATGLETPVCQVGVPMRIRELVQDFLRGRPVLECTSALQPGVGLARPLTVVNFDTKRIDSINDTLPESLRAPNLNVAATIAFVHCTKRKTGNYGFFRDA